MKKLLIIIISLLNFSFQKREENSNIKTTVKVSRVILSQPIQKLKFTTPIEYNKYELGKFSGKPSVINYSSNINANRYRSAINWSIDNFNVNFAGHYNLARWGCGTSCINGVITDLITGRVYDIPSATIDYQFKIDSRLLIVNPPDSNGFYDECNYCEPELWVWNDEMKKFEKLK